jgi:hypothetical protein
MWFRLQEHRKNWRFLFSFLKITACSRNKRPRRQTTNFFVFARFGRAAREQKIFSKKEKTQTAGLASATIFIASCVNTRLKRFFFFFFFFGKLKKKPQAHAHLLANVCSFLRCLRIAYSHRLLPNSHFSSLRQHRNGATKSFLPAI